jgi:hypothetical protein
LSSGALLLVHGSGVRLRSFEPTVEHAIRQAAAAGLRQEVIRCLWGDPLGVEFEGKSIPREPGAETLADEGQDFAEWDWLLDDPLLELYTLTIRDSRRSDVSIPGREAP